MYRGFLKSSITFSKQRKCISRNNSYKQYHTMYYNNFLKVLSLCLNIKYLWQWTCQYHQKRKSVCHCLWTRQSKGYEGWRDHKWIDKTWGDEKACELKNRGKLWIDLINSCLPFITHNIQLTFSYHYQFITCFSIHLHFYSSVHMHLHHLNFLSANLWYVHPS